MGIGKRAEENSQHSGEKSILREKNETKLGAWFGQGNQGTLSRPGDRGSMQTLGCSRATPASSDRKQCREVHINVSGRKVRTTRGEPVKAGERRAEPIRP